MKLSNKDLSVILAALDYTANDLSYTPEGEEVAELLERLKRGSGILRNK